MAVFGFSGVASESTGFDALARYGAALSLPEGTDCTSPSNAFGYCRAPGVVAADGIVVALQGTARLSDGVQQSGTDCARDLLGAYRAGGERAIGALSGRFAVAIFDSRARRTILAVDPMGIERMTYAVHGGEIVFSTSAEWVANSPGIDASLSAQSIFNYLLLHMVPSPDTAFRSVAKLRPGTLAVLENGRLRVERHWQPRFEEGGHATFPDLKRELHDALHAAVRDARPDARSGAFLSGGLDSSTVAGMLSDVGHKPAKSFSIGFGYPDYDELPYARIAVQHFGLQPHEYVVRGDDIVDTFHRIAKAYDEPFGNSSALPVYYCAKLARENGVDHLLAGDGGDELFAGNTRYVEQQVFERYQLVPGMLRKYLLEPALRHWPGWASFNVVRRGRGYIQKANVPLPTRLESWNLIHQVGASALLHEDFISAVDVEAPFRAMHDVWDSVSCNDIVNRMMHYDWQYTLSDNDLRKVETMSAMAGVRVSYPMLDKRVVDMSLRVPTSMKMPDNQLRHFYKTAMQGFLPEAIINKKKHGFGLPFGLWLQDSRKLHDLIFGNLASLRSRRVIRSQFIDQLLDLHVREDARHYGVFIWVLAMLEQWFQEHDVAPRH